jgi:hypothetical protein
MNPEQQRQVTYQAGHTTSNDRGGQQAMLNINRDINTTNQQLPRPTINLNDNRLSLLHAIIPRYLNDNRSQLQYHDTTIPRYHDTTIP